MKLIRRTLAFVAVPQTERVRVANAPQTCRKRIAPKKNTLIYLFDLKRCSLNIRRTRKMFVT